MSLYNCKADARWRWLLIGRGGGREGGSEWSGVGWGVTSLSGGAEHPFGNRQFIRHQKGKKLLFRLILLARWQRNYRLGNVFNHFI